MRVRSRRGRHNLWTTYDIYGIHIFNGIFTGSARGVLAGVENAYTESYMSAPRNRTRTSYAEMGVFKTSRIVSSTMMQTGKYRLMLSGEKEKVERAVVFWVMIWKGYPPDKPWQGGNDVGIRSIIIQCKAVVLDAWESECAGLAETIFFMRKVVIEGCELEIGVWRGGEGSRMCGLNSACHEGEYSQYYQSMELPL
ncbi:hypothetical protein B0H11DRAFT_1916866 [Mycena galericulata]|nr:hypothetical protein B0H11DRAFT_1916866 [Mycena galericulata]